MFWGVSSYAVTYVDHIDFKDDCGNKIILKVTRTLTNVYGQCGSVQCNVNIEPEDNSGQYIDKYENMVWDNGSAIAQIYDFNQSVYFFYPYNGIYGIDFSVGIVTYCGTFHYEFSPPEFDNVITVLGCTEDACTSSFNYCEFYLDLEDIPEKWENSEQMPKLKSVSYIDPVLGIQTLDESNNGNIFDFPYFGRDANVCGYHPNLFDFVNDMNEYLVQSGIGGNCEFYYTNLPSYCKRYIRFHNTGVFFYEMGVTDYPFYYEAGSPPYCEIAPENPVDNPVSPSLDFPISTACLPEGVVNENSDVNKETMDIVKYVSKLALNNELEKKTGVQCYPNITSTEFFIENSLRNKYRVNIYSLSGQLIKQFSLYNQIKKIDVSSFNQGMYIIRFRDLENGGIQVKKLIVQ